MLTLAVIALAYVGLHIGLYKIFEERGVAGWKAFVPVMSEIEWCRIVGRPLTSVFWLYFPVVGFFVGVGMLVDLARSYGRFSFGQHLAIAIAPFIYVPMMAFSKDLKFYGQGYTLLHEWKAKMRDAVKSKDPYQIEKAERANPFPAKSVMREWAEAVLFAVFAAHFIRLFLIEAYTIPTSSMEGSLLVGDFLFVSKAHYGIRLPMTPISFPLVHNILPVTGGESYTTAIDWGYHRLPALQSVERFDPVVFNYPEGDSVFAIPDYSREYYNLKYTGQTQALAQMMQRFPVRVRPVDKRDHYIKRCVGIPNDVIEVRAGELFVNGEKAPEYKGVQYQYAVYTRVQLAPDRIEDDLGITFARDNNNNYYQGIVFGNPTAIEQLRKYPNIDSVVRMLSRPSERESKTFPYSEKYAWNIDYYGPLTIPAKGATVQLTMDNLPIYRRIIDTYEGNTLELKEGQIIINGTPTNSYTFKMNYYWMMGDNRNQSADSRSWGFVPEDHIVGKPLFVWLSFKNGVMADGVRWNRMFMSASGKN